MKIGTSCEEKWIPVRLVCEILSVSRQRVHVLINEGKIRAMKLGPKKCMVNYNDVVNYKKFRDDYMEVLQKRYEDDKAKFE